MKTLLVLFVFQCFLLTCLSEAKGNTPVTATTKDVPSSTAHPNITSAQKLTSQQPGQTTKQNGTKLTTQPDQTKQNGTTNLKKISETDLYSIYTLPPTMPAGTTSKSPLASLSPRVRQLLDQLGMIIPGLKDRLNSGGLGLSSSQLKTINDFVQVLMNSMNNSKPMSLDDILKTLRSLGLFGSRGFDLSYVEDVLEKQALAVCDNVRNLTSNMNDTIGTVMNAKEWFNNTLFSNGQLANITNMTMKDVSDWCHQFVGRFQKAPLPKDMTYSPYHWKKCQSDISQVLRFDQWTLQMLDASGKPGSGILRGNLKFMGNYKECQQVFHKDVNTLSIIQGKVCRAFIKVAGLGFASALSGGQTPRIQWDICMPKSCQDTDLNLALYQRSLIEDVYVVCTKEFDMSTDEAAIVAIAVLTLFGILLVAGTIMEFCIKNQRPHYNYWKYASNGHANQGFDNGDKHGTTSFTEPNGKPAMVELRVPNGDNMYPEISMNGKKPNNLNGTAVRFSEPPNGNVCHDKKEDGAKQVDIKSLPKWQRALLAFSIPRNTEKILSVKAAPGAIGCLHGIRVLSMGWVILGHVIIFQTTAGQFQNPMDIFSLISTMGFQLILNAPLSVDTFFFMSGFLTCYLYMKTLGKKGRVTAKEFIMYYVHRYWRLTPSLIIWIMIVACLLRYVGEGRPAWTDYLAAANCRNNWWVNLLYINNVYKQEEACVGVTWFLAHDMQFYVVAPLALIPWVYGQKALGFLASFVFIGIHVASTIWLEIKYNADMLRNQPHYSEEIYFKPYTRAAPFAIGLIMGWIMWKTKGKVRMNKCLVALGWTVCFGLILVLTLVSYDENKDMADSWSKTGRVVFETFYRPLWAIAIAWLVFACATGYGGYINSILSWEGWLPLSRLTYSAFLIHLTILGFEGMQPEYTILYTMTSLSYQFLGYFVMAYAVGFILTVAVESPMLGLEKIILG